MIPVGFPDYLFLIALQNGFDWNSKRAELCNFLKKMKSIAEPGARMPEEPKRAQNIIK
ncbi:MAG: hypothetical protein RMX35_30550 [Nostoc sp. DcaGUA01]|nr:hypothetical protein [Nostoc sp. DcaGUA01]